MNVIVIKDIKFINIDNIPILIKVGETIFIPEEGIGFKDGMYFDVFKNEYRILNN